MRHFLLACVSCLTTDFCSVYSLRVLDTGETQSFLYLALVGSNPANDLARCYQHLSPLTRSLRCSAAATHSSKLSSRHMVYWCLHTSQFICHNSSVSPEFLVFILPDVAITWDCSIYHCSPVLLFVQHHKVCLYRKVPQDPSPIILQSLKAHSVITSGVTFQTRSFHSAAFSGPALLLFIWYLVVADFLADPSRLRFVCWICAPHLQCSHPTK